MKTRKFTLDLKHLNSFEGVTRELLYSMITDVIRGCENHIAINTLKKYKILIKKSK